MKDWILALLVLLGYAFVAMVIWWFLEWLLVWQCGPLVFVAAIIFALLALIRSAIRLGQ